MGNRSTIMLLSKLPARLQNRVKSLDPENGLIDDCKYILYFRDGVNCDGYTSIPVRSITEAVYFVKNSSID